MSKYDNLIIERNKMLLTLYYDAHKLSPQQIYHMQYRYFRICTHLYPHTPDVLFNIAAVTLNKHLIPICDKAISSHKHKHDMDYFNYPLSIRSKIYKTISQSAISQWYRLDFLKKLYIGAQNK